MTYSRNPQTVEQALDSTLGQIARMSEDDYHPAIDGVTLSPQFGADLCHRVIRLERLVLELAGACAAMKRDLDDLR